MDDYVSNSFKSREEPQKQKIDVKSIEPPEKRASKVISGEAKLEKKGEVRKFFESFLEEDLKNIKNYIISDVLVPTIKRAITDIITNGVYMIVYPGSTARRNDGQSSRIQYDRMSGIRSFNNQSISISNSNQTVREESLDFIYKSVWVDTFQKARDIIDGMDEIMEQYSVVRVADLYDLAGISCPHTGNNYGWTDIRSAKPVLSNGGFIIKMPRPIPMNSIN